MYLPETLTTEAAIKTYRKKVLFKTISVTKFLTNFHIQVTHHIRPCTAGSLL
jgi:hypothetical protein